MARLLVTNCTQDPATGGVYLLDTRSGETRRVHDHPTRGMAITPDGIYAVGNKGAVYHLDPKTWKSRLKVDLKLDGSHDLRWINGGFYLVASQGNQVVRLDPDLRPVDRMQIVEDEGDVCHANCLLEVNGQLLLTIFTLSPGRREEKRHSQEWRTNGKVLRLDFPNKRYDIAYEPLSQPHSMVWQDNLLYLCESFSSEVSAVDLKARTKKTFKKEHGFVRGLVFAEGNAYIGISRVRTKIPLSQRIAGLFRMRCGVIEMDPKTWKPRRSFRMPGSETYELLTLDE